VARLDQSFGVKYIVDVLRGAKSEAVHQRGHDTLSTHGILQDWADKPLTQIIYQLIDLGVLQRTPGDRPIVQLTDDSGAVLRGEREVRLIKPAAVHKTRAQIESWEGVDRGLFEHLRELRKRTAAERSVPAFVIFNDATLRDLARHRPTTPGAMRDIQGVGAKKRTDLGERFTTAISEYCAENNVDVDEHEATIVTEPDAIVRPKNSRVRPNLGKARAIEMLRDGRSIEDVARVAERAESTVWGYLNELLAEEADVNVSHWIEDAVRDRVLAAAQPMEGRQLRPVYEALNEEVPYEIIKVVLTHAEALYNA
jgi:ATP-dependent DNA helicase RecQ